MTITPPIRSPMWSVGDRIVHSSFSSEGRKEEYGHVISDEEAMRYAHPTLIRSTVRRNPEGCFLWMDSGHMVYSSHDGVKSPPPCGECTSWVDGPDDYLCDECRGK